MTLSTNAGVAVNSNDLAAGAVVGYSETGLRRFITVARKSRAAEVEIEYLGGGRETVPIEKMEDFLNMGVNYEPRATFHARREAPKRSDR